MMDAELAQGRSAARSAVRKKVKADPRKISARQKAQDAGIHHLLEQHGVAMHTAGNVANNLVSDWSMRKSYQIMRSSQTEASGANHEDQNFLERRMQVSRAPSKSKMEAGQAICDRKMEPIYRKPRSLPTERQKRLSRMTKDSGGACEVHRVSKKFVTPSGCNVPVLC